jgi:hypothetical protein
MMAATVTFVLDDERGWVVADSVSTACPHCEAKLKVKPEKIGGIAHCPNCQRLICLRIGVSQPANPSERPSGNSELLATEQQKALARSLGCQFHEAITRYEIAELIEIAEENQRAAQWAATQSRPAVSSPTTEESPEDTRLSAATARQIIDSLDDRGKCAVLITVPIDRIQSFNNLEGLPFAIASSEAMSSEDTAHFLMSVATNLYKHLGLQPTTN